MHKYCYDKDFCFNVWPDGRPYVEQYDVTVKLLMLINDEIKTIKGAQNV